jgi:hypothetical protein
VEASHLPLGSRHLHVDVGDCKQLRSLATRVTAAVQRVCKVLKDAYGGGKGRVGSGFRDFASSTASLEVE